MKYIEKSVSSKEPRFLTRVLRSIPATRKKLTHPILRKIICGFFPNCKWNIIIYKQTLANIFDIQHCFGGFDICSALILSFNILFGTYVIVMATRVSLDTFLLHFYCLSSFVKYSVLEFSKKTWAGCLLTFCIVRISLFFKMLLIWTIMTKWIWSSFHLFLVTCFNSDQCTPYTGLFSFLMSLKI